MNKEEIQLLVVEEVLQDLQAIITCIPMNKEEFVGFQSALHHVQKIHGKYCYLVHSKENKE